VLFRAGLAAFLACLFVSIGTAAAANRYATATGSSTATENCLNPVHPCSLATALKAENLETGDTVEVAPGTYVETATLEIPKHVTVAGEAGKERPLIKTSGANGIGLSSTQIVTLRDLRIESVAGTQMGFKLTGGLGTVVERVESTGKASFGCFLRSGMIANSLCQAEPSAEAGVGFASSLITATPESMPVTVENVTAVGGHVGLEVGAGNEGGIFAYVYNTIALGGNIDVLASTSGESSGVEIQLEHSSYEVVEETGNGSKGVTPHTQNGNQTGPIFVDELAGNYREAANSPTIRAGTTGHVAGEFDLDLNPRKTTCEGTAYVDIGAYQSSECPPPVPPSGGGSGGGTTGSGSTTTTPSTPTAPTVPTTPTPSPPRLSKLSVKGTTVTFTLSVATKVKVMIGKELLRTVKGKAGVNRVKLPASRLKPGVAKLRLIAVGGNSLTKKFRVAAR
jgi:hypothetical protein